MSLENSGRKPAPVFAVLLASCANYANDDEESGAPGKIRTYDLRLRKLTHGRDSSASDVSVATDSGLGRRVEWAVCQARSDFAAGAGRKAADPGDSAEVSACVLSLEARGQIRAQNRIGCGVVISEDHNAMGSTLHPVPIASCSRSSFKCMHSTGGV
jgi:hypothetical protein